MREHNSFIVSLQALQKTQEDEIARLEKEIEEKNFQHENRIRVLKTKFLQEQRSFEEQAEKKVTAMSEKADKVNTELYMYTLMYYALLMMHVIYILKTHVHNVYPTLSI